MLRSRYTLIGLLGVVAVIAVAAFAAFGGSSSVVVGQGSDRFPSGSLTDWASYGDQLSVVSVVSEEEIAPPSDVIALGEGYIGRAVTLRVEDTLWRRQGAPAASGTIRVITYGWVLENGRRNPAATWGAPRLQVGGRYLAPLVRAPRDGAEWTALSDGATLPLAGDVVTTAGVLGAPTALANSMRGKSTAAVAGLLARTAPDPIAVKYWDLDPKARAQAVLRERGGTS